MHNSWCRLRKLFDLLSFSIIFIPFQSPLTANHILCYLSIYMYVYIYIPRNAQKLNRNKTKINTEQCPKVVALCWAFVRQRKAELACRDSVN